MSRRRILEILALTLIPPTLFVIAASALGWLRWDWSWGGVGLFAGTCVGWAAFLAALAEIAGYRRDQAAAPRSAGAPIQPPVPLPDFAGREEEIERLTRTLKPGGRAAITGLVGMGGVGKTELAKVVANRVRERFSDGVLWADCGQRQADEIADLLAAAFGVQLTGTGLAAKAAHWRGIASGKEALIVFDDVGPDQEVEPLLPPPGRCASLITTRHAHHPALQGAEAIPLDQFTPTEAAALARRVLGDRAARAQAAEATRLFELLGYLPLALHIALRQAALCGWTLAHLNDRLETQGAIWVLDRAEHVRKSLNATFETAWANLPDDLR